MIELPLTDEQVARIAEEMPHNECGVCTVCCTIMGVTSLNKPYYCDCEHQGPGCRVYAERPMDCRVYSCLWWAKALPDEFRPDKIGLMFDIGQSDGELWLNVFEVWPDASETPRLNEIMSVVCEAAERYGCTGIRCFPYGARVGVGYKIGAKYPDEGDTDGQMPFQPHEGVLYFAGQRRKNLKPLAAVRESA